MSAYPPQQEMQQESNAQLFGGGYSAPATPSPARQLLEDVAKVTSVLQELATTHPELTESIEAALQVLGQGVVQASQQMQSVGSEGGTPPIG
jgi:hypothetical protein